MESPKTYRDNRPWGEEFIVEYPNTVNASKVKILTILPNEATSLQRHKMRDEFWHVISGNGTVQIGTEKLDASAGKDFFVPKEMIHRLEGGTESLVLFEVAFGQFDENDIERLEDRYNRT